MIIKNNANLTHFIRVILKNIPNPNPFNSV